jgi:hypothetical protein
MKQFSATLIMVLIFFSPSILSAQGKTIVIKIIDKQYIPPTTTAKIPQEFKDQGARLVVRAGDVIKICNADKFVAKPFSLSGENRFEGISGKLGLRPGDCIMIKARNSTDKPIQFRLADDIHVGAKLFMVVLPVNWPDEGEENTTNDATSASEVKPRKPCISSESQAFSQMTGSWKNSVLKLTIKGSCEAAGGEMEWVEWCSPLEDEINKYPHYPRTFTGAMDGETLVLAWTIPAQGPHKKQKGTAYVHPKTGGAISVKGFACGDGGLNR